MLLTETLNLKTFSWMLMVRAKSGLCYWKINWDSVSNHDPLLRPNAFMLSTYLLQETISKVFNKILSRWQKLWSRWREKKLVTKVQLILWAPKAQVLEKLWNLGLLEILCFYSILEQKFEFLNRTQTSLNCLAFLFSDSTGILYHSKVSYHPLANRVARYAILVVGVISKEK